MRSIMKALIMVAITMAVTISLSINRIGEDKSGEHMITSKDDHQEDAVVVGAPNKKRMSRFLAATTNPRAASQCHKDNEVCYSAEFGNRTTCCNNKCVDLQFDDKNCGACKNKCRYTQSCCRGECVYLSLDKRHCGQCNNRCPYGNYCIYGMCEYP